MQERFRWNAANVKTYPAQCAVLFDNNGNRLLLDSNIPLKTEQWQRGFADPEKVKSILAKVVTSIKPRQQIPLASPVRPQQTPRANVQTETNTKMPFNILL